MSRPAGSGLRRSRFLRYEREVRSTTPGRGAALPALILLAGLALPTTVAADGWLLAAGVGLLEPDSSLGPAPRFAVEGAWLPASLGGSLAVTGGLAWARPTAGAGASLLGLPSSGWSASAGDLTLEAALAWRGQGALGPITPYASAGLALHLIWMEVNWRGAPSTSREVRPGLSTRLGAEWTLGAAGGPFLELGWSVAAASAGRAGMLEVGGFLAALGWRMAL